jgi:uncharacterized membrane protein (UPF0127 family)
MIRGPLSLRYMAALLNCQSAVCFIFLFSVLSSAQAIDVNPVPETINKIYLRRGPDQISVFTIEIVSGRNEMQKGLAKRATIPDDYGMLFILEKASEEFFWMEGMEFGLDILFFDKHRRLIAILPNLMPCEKCTPFKTPANTAYALEINAGIAYFLGLRTGDILVFANE